ncbi:MAG: BatA domain-containing protein [Verrucomicrobiota bacterium]
MEILFTNLAGFWALLGIPVVLAIHLLQRQATQVTISTRFLLEKTRSESTEGRRIERLRASIPLWLQLLLVLILTWLLVEPRWQNNNAVQRVALVLDSSASMQASKQSLLSSLPEILDNIGSPGVRAEFVAIDSSLRNEGIYHGDDQSDLINSIDRWVPLEGEHDPVPALEIARSLVGKDGLVVFVTDHAAPNLPFGAHLLAVGKVIQNVGFTGSSLSNEKGSLQWKALIKNYSDAPQERQWSVYIDDNPQPSRPISLKPGQTLTVGGDFPDQIERFSLVLQPDEFVLDDRLPIIRPSPKTITVSLGKDTDENNPFAAVLASLDGINTTPPANAPPDVLIATYNPLDPAIPNQNAIVSISDRLGKQEASQGQIVAVNDPLVRGLNWQGLIARSSLKIPKLETDNVLLWQGDRPLILLRTIGGVQRLIFNFDLTASNANRLPAFVILVSRFIEKIRNQKIGLANLNVETGQALQLAANSGEEAQNLTVRWDSYTAKHEKTLPLAQLSSFRAPNEPGFFEVSQGDKFILKGAASFADTREADFRDAVTVSSLDSAASNLVQYHTREDPYWKIWTILATAVLLLNWHLRSRRTMSQDRSLSSSSPT